MVLKHEQPSQGESLNAEGQPTAEGILAQYPTYDGPTDEFHDSYLQKLEDQGAVQKDRYQAVRDRIIEREKVSTERLAARGEDDPKSTSTIGAQLTSSEIVETLGVQEPPTELTDDDYDKKLRSNRDSPEDLAGLDAMPANNLRDLSRLAMGKHKKT